MDERIERHDRLKFVNAEIALDERYSAIVNDPLNGCPGDFAEDWAEIKAN